MTNPIQIQIIKSERPYHSPSRSPRAEEPGVDELRLLVENLSRSRIAIATCSTTLIQAWRWLEELDQAGSFTRLWRRATTEEVDLRTKRATNGRLGYATIYVRTSTKKNSDEEGKEKNLSRLVLLLPLIDVHLVSYRGSDRPWPVRRPLRRSTLFEGSIDACAGCMPYMREWNGRAVTFDREI